MEKLISKFKGMNANEEVNDLIDTTSDTEGWKSDNAVWKFESDDMMMEENVPAGSVQTKKVWRKLINSLFGSSYFIKLP